MSEPLQPSNIYAFPPERIVDPEVENHVVRARRPTPKQRRERFHQHLEIVVHAHRMVGSPTSEWVYQNSNLRDMLATQQLGLDEVLRYLGTTLGRSYVVPLDDAHYQQVAQAVSQPEMAAVMHLLLWTFETDHALVGAQAMATLRPHELKYASEAHQLTACLERFYRDHGELSAEAAGRQVAAIDARIQQELPPREAALHDLRPDPRLRRIRALPALREEPDELWPTTPEEERHMVNYLVHAIGAPAVERLLHTRQRVEVMEQCGVAPEQMLAYAVLSLAAVKGVEHDPAALLEIDRQCEANPALLQVSRDLQDAFRRDEDYVRHYLREALKPEIATRQREGHRSACRYQQWCGQALNMGEHEMNDYLRGYHVQLNKHLAQYGIGQKVGIGIEQ